MDVFAEMMPVLQAEEALMAIQLHQAGAGLMESADADRLLRQLRRSAEIKEATATLGDLAAMGIKVETV